MTGKTSCNDKASVVGCMLLANYHSSHSAVSFICAVLLWYFSLSLVVFNCSTSGITSCCYMMFLSKGILLLISICLLTFLIQHIPDFNYRWFQLQMMKTTYLMFVYDVVIMFIFCDFYCYLHGIFVAFVFQFVIAIPSPAHAMFN